MAIKPISPNEVAKAKRGHIPDAVFAVVNKLIAEKFANGKAEITQDAIVAALTKKRLKKSDIFDKGWLDFEAAYRAQGWTVEYDKPGYCEDYLATFTFKAKG